MYKIKIKGIKDIEELSRFIRNSKIRLIIFGEYHGLYGQIKIQEELVQKIKPAFFLYELLEDKKILNEKQAKQFLNKPDEQDFSFVSKYRDLKPIIRLCRKYNLPIIGCDLKNMGVSKNWRKKKFSKEEAKRITKKRELQQSRVINSYKSESLIFALLGNYHLRRNSTLWEKLKEKEAIVIRPDFKWSEKFNDKNKLKKSGISYTIKHKSI